MVTQPTSVLLVDDDPAMLRLLAKWLESAGYNDKTEVHSFMHTDALHVVERFKKLENGNLTYEVTVDDPNVWTKAWAIPARTFQHRPETEFVSEFVCDAPAIDYKKLFGNK